MSFKHQIKGGPSKAKSKGQRNAGKPATEKQLDYIAFLERDTKSDPYLHTNELTRIEASDYISTLKYRLSKQSASEGAGTSPRAPDEGAARQEKVLASTTNGAGQNN